MKEECGVLFEDADFPCEDASLFCDRSTPVARLQGKVTWRRPQDICQSPALFPDNTNLAHAKQGLLGDCWFLCACSFLLKNKTLLNKVLPPDQPQWGDGSYKGSFLFRFWQQGFWTDVIIDDRLPCVNLSLCFSRCHCPTAFWVALLEKAYAKLHGSYERLWAGQVLEALVDLSGGLAERWSLGSFSSEEEEEEQTERDSDQERRTRLDLNLLQPVKDECAISCSTQSSPGGVEELQYHALSVMEWLEVKKESGGEVRLLRIRNPWGRCCWGGAWTGSGVGWSSLHPFTAADLQSRTAEGEFWLDEDEFMSQFDDVTVAYPINDEGHLKSIYSGQLLPHRHQQAGRWIKGLSAGGSRNSSSYTTNPKFWLRVHERGEVLIALLQHRSGKNTEKYAQSPHRDANNSKHQHLQAIALHMWKVEKKRFNVSRLVNKPPCASTHCHAYDREVVLHGHREPGFYLVIPSTYRSGAEARFLLRVFSSSPSSLSALKSPEKASLPAAAAAAAAAAAEGEWETSSFRGSWEEGKSAGGSRNFRTHWLNPCFPFSVSDDPSATPSGINVRITLQQNRPEAELLPIGFHVYKVLEGQDEQIPADRREPVASCVPHCYTQDVSLACSLPNGDYTVTPSTYQPGCSASFTLSLSRRIHRKVVKSQESLGKAIQEVTHISVMRRSPSETVAAPLVPPHLSVPLGPP